ncbi:protein kinase [bacterium]|nr:protein kinase [bacterium]
MIGKTISHYKILQKLGEGGMGVVYKAEDTQLRRLVALKFLPAFIQDEIARQRFIQEARAASSLDHPNICTIHEIGQAPDGQLFIVMAFYEGENLKEKLAAGPLPVELAVDITRQIASGLQKAHQAGIIHRDIKPANIMITREGKVKILDFGLSKLARQQQISQIGAALGTPPYMSPEQASGVDLDHRTDVWSLGVVLYEMLVGRVPFKADYDQATIYMIVNQEPSAIRKFRSDVPQYVEDLCLQCLKKDKSSRPQSMDDVLEWLNKEKASESHPGRRKAEHGKSFALALGFLFIFIVIVIGWHIFFHVSQPETTSPKGWRVAVLPFQEQADQQKTDKPLLIQSLIVGELLGVEELRIIDPLSLNGLIESSIGGFEPAQEQLLYRALRKIDVSFLIHGSLNKTGSSYFMQSRIIDLSTAEIIFSNSIVLANDKDLFPAVKTLSQKMLYGFQIKVLTCNKEKDLRPWLKYGSQNYQAVQSFIQANQYNYRREDNLAEESLRHAIELDSSFISPRIWLISKLVERGERQEASHHYSRLLALQPYAGPFEQVMIQWAGACLADDMALQERYLTIALDYFPQNNVLLYSLARVRYILADYQGSLEASNEMINMKWQYSSAFYLSAANYYQLGMNTEAEKMLRQALSIRPVEPHVFSLMARVCIEKGETTEAEEYENRYLSSVRERKIPLARLYADLALQNYDLQRYDSAVKYYRLAIKNDRERAEYHKGLADALYCKGSTGAAIDEYLNTLRLDSNSVDSHYKLGQIFDQEEKIQQAVFHYLHYLKYDSSGAHAAAVRKRLSLLQP